MMPSLHMPLQSGYGPGAEGDAALVPSAIGYPCGSSKTMRAAMPDAAITTDIIVGFPGETPGAFQGTLDVVRRAR